MRLMRLISTQEVPMKSLLSLLALTLPMLASMAAPVPNVKPEEVGVSSERLALIDRMIDRRIAAGEIADRAFLQPGLGRQPLLREPPSDDDCNHRHEQDNGAHGAAP
jgi:hypothetical protein